MKRAVLGRGLETLIPTLNRPQSSPENIDTITDGDLKTISVESIVVNPYQPRKEFGEESLRQLSESIKTEGLIQPIVVRSLGGGRYQLIAGERRWQATKMAGIQAIRAIVERKERGLDEFVTALLENLQREDLNAMDEAQAFGRLADEFKLNHDEIARRMGRSRAAVSNALRLLNLPSPIQDALRARRVTAGQVRPLVALEESVALGLFREIEAKGLSAREVEALVKSGRSASRESKPSRVPKTPDGAHVARADAEDRLMKTWGRSVRIVGDGAKGHVRIEYYSKADLIDLVERLLVAR